jgi:deazaflavin-dependent oxidoreductase (nitroreductase family)
MDRPPTAVRLFDPVARRLLRVGAPMGPNALITVRGRRSGEPRSAGVALMEIDGRRWVVSAYGETHWVRNLREAREAVLTVRGRPQEVRAVELTPAEAEAFFRGELIPYVNRLPLPLRLVSRLFVGEIARDPAAAAQRRPVFELQRVPALRAATVSGATARRDRPSRVAHHANNDEGAAR